MSDYTRKPDRKDKPYTHDKWRRLGILNATPLERLIMLELYHMFGTMDWLTGSEEETWDTKDMRKFVGYLAEKIEVQNPKKNQGSKNRKK